MEFNPQIQLAGLLEWMAEQMHACHGKTAVIGISGGKDSSTVAALAVAAYGRENVLGVLMPDGVQPDIDYSQALVQHLLQDVHDNLYAMAEKNLEDNTFDMTSWEEVKEMAQGKGGFARTKWCGSLECELAMKEKAGVSSRCMPLKQSGTTGKCVVCGKECTTDIYWGVAY